jgi:hypothetical protein
MSDHTANIKSNRTKSIRFCHRKPYLNLLEMDFKFVFFSRRTLGPSCTLSLIFMIEI